MDSVNPVVATLNEPSRLELGRIEGQEDPWQKACVLTLGRQSDPLLGTGSLTLSKMAEVFEVTQVFGC